MILPPPFVPTPSIVKGVGASPGVVIGQARVIDRQKGGVPHYRLENAQAAELELVRLGEAFHQAEVLMKKAKASLPQELTAQELVFDAHLMLLKDRLIRNQTEEIVAGELINAEWALEKTLNQARLMFGAIEDSYIRSRLADIELVIDSLWSELMGKRAKVPDVLEPDTIIVAHEFSPVILTTPPYNGALGLVTETGSRTSHTSIVAQALDLPAVVAASRCTDSVCSGDTVIVDGTSGHLIVRPDENTLKFYQARQKALAALKIEIVRCAHMPAETLDGQKITVLGNMELVEELAPLLNHGGEGVGLYRTEFLYLAQKSLPTEEELFENYRLVISTVNPRPVTIRTLDLGLDKISAAIKWPGLSREPNPALGLRAIRFCLKNESLFRTQLRAILRASVYGEIRLMVPMIASLDEWRMFKSLFFEVKEELAGQGCRLSPRIPLGVMIEVPAAAMIADLLAGEADFFSIGTNDLIQYALAIDRVNPEVAGLYQPFHPAVLRMIKNVVDAARAAGIPLAVCGDMATGVLTAALLVGLGVTGLSMPFGAIPKIKRLIRMASLKELRSWAETALSRKTAEEIQAALSAVVKRRFPDLCQQDG